jgi:HK97 gp10 family phage protein
MDANLQREITELISRLGKMSEQAKRQTTRILSKAAAPLVDEIQARAPVSDEDHYRYSTPKAAKSIRAPKGSGKKIATYTPGNLERSFNVLRFRRAKSAVFVGATLDKTGSTGTFTGKRTDGYYLAWQEYGAPNAGIPPRPFVGPARDAAGGEVLQLAIADFKKTIEREAVKGYKKTIQ